MKTQNSREAFTKIAISFGLMRCLGLYRPPSTFVIANYARGLVDQMKQGIVPTTKHVRDCKLCLGTGWLDETGDCTDPEHVRDGKLCSGTGQLDETGTVPTTEHVYNCKLYSGTGRPVCLMTLGTVSTSECVRGYQLCSGTSRPVYMPRLKIMQITEHVHGFYHAQGLLFSVTYESGSYTTEQ